MSEHEVIGPYVPKGIRIWAELIRTFAAVSSVLLNICVLIVVLSR